MRYNYYQLYTVIVMILMMSNLSSIEAQEGQTRFIKSHENLSRLMLLDEEYATNRNKIDQGMTIATRAESNWDENEIVLPLVFHVVYHDANSKIPREQIFAQLEVLNEDFNSVGENVQHPAMEGEGFGARTAATGIHFCLAGEDEYGSPSEGIQYIYAENSAWQMDDKMKSAQYGGANTWDARRFINIWVVDLQAGLSGYAQMPGGLETTDGIVIDYSFFGVEGHTHKPYHLGRTLTHLMGNYLNLYSLWGPSPCADDGVEDTPIHNAPNFGNPGYKHFSLCDGNEVEMTMNFMDNSDDQSLAMFTVGQRNRMLDCLASYRSGLNAPLSVQCLSDEEMIEPIEDAGISIFPNPVIEKINVAFDPLYQGEKMEIKVFAADRKMVSSQSIDVDASSNLEILTEGWPSGIYLIHIGNERQHIYSKKIIVVNHN